MIFSHWRLNHFYSFLLDHGSRAANKHFPLGRSVKNESPACLPASTVRIAPSGHTQLFAVSRPRLTPAQPQQGGGHQPLFAGSFSLLCPKPFFQRAGACCAEMPQDDAFRADVPKFLGTSTANNTTGGKDSSLWECRAPTASLPLLTGKEQRLVTEATRSGAMHLATCCFVHRLPFCIG